MGGLVCIASASGIDTRAFSVTSIVLRDGRLQLEQAKLSG